MKHYLLEIDFRISAHPSFTDEVDNPFLALVLRQIQSLRKIA